MNFGYITVNGVNSNGNCEVAFRLHIMREKTQIAQFYGDIRPAGCGADRGNERGTGDLGRRLSSRAPCHPGELLTPVWHFRPSFAKISLLVTHFTRPGGATGPGCRKDAGWTACPTGSSLRYGDR